MYMYIHTYLWCELLFTVRSCYLRKDLREDLRKGFPAKNFIKIFVKTFAAKRCCTNSPTREVLRGEECTTRFKALRKVRDSLMP